MALRGTRPLLRGWLILNRGGGGWGSEGGLVGWSGFPLILAPSGGVSYFGWVGGWVGVVHGLRHIVTHGGAATLYKPVLLFTFFMATKNVNVGCSSGITPAQAQEAPVASHFIASQEKQGQGEGCNEQAIWDWGSLSLGAMLTLDQAL